MALSWDNLGTKFVTAARSIIAGTGLSGGGTLDADRTLNVVYGTGSGTAAQGNDARLSDTRTPTDSSVTNAKVSAGAAIAESKLSLASDAVAGTASRRTLGTGSTQACAGNDARLSDTRDPNALSVTNASVSASAAIAESKLNLASDAVAGTASRRTLGTSSTSAAAGNDSRLSDTRTPTALSVTNASVSATAAIAESKLSLASDAAAGTASRRTLGTGSTQAAAGNDSRLSDTRDPNALSVTNASVSTTAAIAESKLSLASDAAAGTASRRTLGTTSTSAAAGNHGHVAEGARRHKILTAPITVGLSVGFNAITFNNTTWTRGTAVTANTNNLTVNVTGVYLVGIVATFVGGTAGFRSTLVQVNGTTAFEGGVGPNTTVRMPMTAPLPLTAGDVLTMQVYVDTVCSLQAGGSPEVGLSAIFMGT